MNIPENIFNTLTDEQKQKIEAVQTPEELLALAKKTGYALSPEQLEAVAGGDGSSWCTIFSPDHDCYLLFENTNPTVP